MTSEKKPEVAEVPFQIDGGIIGMFEWNLRKVPETCFVGTVTRLKYEISLK